ncbi:hypothetical protein GBAR_LOCUS937, partial [Geodia barretti]
KVVSNVLNNVSLVINDPVVQIRCEFKEGIEGASCVLVYREYGNKTLVVEEYPQNTINTHSQSLERAVLI